VPKLVEISLNYDHIPGGHRLAIPQLRTELEKEETNHGFEIDSIV
jgi:hypothetical protein